MRFSEYLYQRPDFPAYKEIYLKEVARLKHADSYEATVLALEHLNNLRQESQTASKLAMIRHSLDTRDLFYTDEVDYWDQQEPFYEELDTAFFTALLASPYLDKLKKIYPKTLFLYGENKLRLFNAEIIPLLQKENQLMSQYSRLISAAQIPYRGKQYNLSQLQAFHENQDRQVRHETQQLYWAFFETHEADFAAIFEKLVQVRHKIATTLGFENYLEYADIKLNRWDYSREMIQAYRKEIRKNVVPLVENLAEVQRKRLDLPELFYYDLPLFFPNGNPQPQGTLSELVAKAKRMYQEMSPETAAFFDFMEQRQLLDLVSRAGKQAGGYCEYLDTFHSPFIFANFNGTSGDVDVLTHEAGHAFQAYSSRWIKEPELVFPNFEAAEIHSMSMEFFAWPWLTDFFKEDTEKYRFTHLADALQFLPYGALVDHFQEEIYQHPEWRRQEQKNCWQVLEKLYQPQKNYGDHPFLNSGTFWYRQGHIFEDPFYYIDYTLAQVCAFQFWIRQNIEKDPAVWSDYLAICQVGGTLTFLEIVKKANLASPFAPDTLKKVTKVIADYLEQIPESHLQN